jgi:ADP-L-glycero-D-manno-heptose 6-epimerase
MNTQAPFLITGAAGFIGSRMVESCNQRRLPIISVDQREYFSQRKLGAQPLDFGLILDRDELPQWLPKNSPSLSAIIHLGACANTFEMDEAYLARQNIEYSKMLWNYACSRKLPFVYASSAATYGDGSNGYDDDEASIPRLRPLNPYGDSKQIFDLWALAEEKKGHAPPQWAGFKFFNVYGYGEFHKNKMASVVLHAFNQIRETSKVKLFRSHRPGIADGEQKRDFVSVEDVVSVLHFAVEHPIRRGIFNLGTGRAQSFNELADAVFKALGKPRQVEFIDTPEQIRDRYQYFTEGPMERLRAQGYTAPFASLDEGVARTVSALLKNT